MERPQESESRSRLIPMEILQDILLRLPAKDVVRSSCVSKLWRCIVGDPSFRKLHGTHHVAAPSESEALLVSVKCESGRPYEASVFNLSPGNAMCRVAIPNNYSLMNVCNGFLCFALHGKDQAPVVVCNPITGETLELPKAPLVSVSGKDGGGDISLRHRLVLGFSPPTKEYKMFRLSCPYRYSLGGNTNYITVYTLGDSSGGWRQYSYISGFCPVDGLPAPVHIDGNLYVPVEGNGGSSTAGASKRTARMLVINVATETRCTYRLPYNYENYHKGWAMQLVADGFDLNGKMCLAVNVFKHPSRELQFWVMESPDELEEDDDKLYWDLRFCFEVGDRPFYVFRPRGVWLDNDEMLYYRHGECLYKHDTRKHSSSSNGGPVLFDQQLELPEAAAYRWNVCGGYRSCLLSPLTFALPPSQVKKRKEPPFEHTLLRAITQSKRPIKGPWV
ncbi:unnamed protein product [Urochloa humidicola]